MTTTKPIVAIACMLVLASCGTQSDDPATPEDTVTPSALPNPDQPVSILRPDVAQPSVQETALEPLQMVIGFPDGGAELDAEALTALQTVLDSEQLGFGGPILIGGHSDSGGSDRVNLDASQARALAVAGWLVEQGVDEDRIDVIVFGEQNPIEPNALSNGDPNEAGRSANRRVVIEIPTMAIASASDDEVATDTAPEVSDSSVEVGDEL